MPKNFDIVIAGEINLDLILSGLPAAMPLERELLASGFDMTLGSSSAILAHNLALLDTKVGFVTMVGPDPLGSIALGYLSRTGVDLSKTLPGPAGCNTGVTILLTHPGQRHILTYPGTMSRMRVEDLDLKYLVSARHFHLSSLFLQKGLQPGLPALFRQLKAAGLTLSLDTNDDPEDRWQSDLQELLGLVDIVMPNNAEACRMTGTNDVEEAAEALAQQVPLVAIKCGGRGGVDPPSGTPLDGPGRACNSGRYNWRGRQLQRRLPQGISAGTIARELCQAGESCRRALNPAPWRYRGHG